MTKCNPTMARAGDVRRFSVTVAKKGVMRHVATLHDRLDEGWNGIEFQSIVSGNRALLAAWAHAKHIMEPEAAHSYDYSAH